MNTSNSEHHHFVVADDRAGERLDRFLTDELAGPSRSRIQALIKQGCALLGSDKIEEPNYRVKPGESITLMVPPAAPAEPEAEDLPLNVVFEDDDLIIIDKPAGMVVHPAAGNWSGTLVNALLHHCAGSLSGIGGVARPGIVHRLDKDTSGLMVVAKNDTAHQGLARQFADHGRTGPLERAYLALVWGVPRPAKGRIDAPLDRHPTHRLKRAVAKKGGKHATTNYRILEIYNSEGNVTLASLLRCELETGRTHQIRVHMAHAGHPLLGDAMYGSGFASRANRLSSQSQDALRQLDRQALHAYMLGFAHPLTGEHLHFESKPASKLAKLMETLVLHG